VPVLAAGYLRFPVPGAPRSRGVTRRLPPVLPQCKRSWISASHVWLLPLQGSWICLSNVDLLVTRAVSSSKRHTRFTGRAASRGSIRDRWSSKSSRPSVRCANLFSQLASSSSALLFLTRTLLLLCVAAVHCCAAQSSADVYLAGTVMLIFGMGLYGLFVSNASAGVGSESDRALSGSSLFGMFALKVTVRI
jgi:hypothetical protein